MNSEASKKADLVDQLGRPLRDLRVSVIDACNFRCTYCMPIDSYPEYYEFLRKPDRLSFEEIVRVVRVFVGLGVKKVRLTGGEPLLRKDLPSLVADLKRVDGVNDLALTTNGYHLEKHAQSLKDAGLDRVTVSLDSLDPVVFGEINGRGTGLDRVLAGIDAAMAAGFAPLKINVTVKRGVNDSGLVDIAERFRGDSAIPRYIEYMDVGNRNGWRMEDVVPSADVVQRISERFPVEEVAENYPGEVVSRYRYRDGAGEFGVISSITRPFCRTCSRARISADGKVYTCLFASDGLDLRAPLRDGASDDELLALVSALWRDREDRYSELRALDELPEASDPKVEMYHIGG